jgi:hypothetical protein
VDRELRFPRTIDFDRDYWLCRCEGFRVESPNGRVGVVEEVRFLSRLDRPDAVVVRGGLFGMRRTVIPIADVADVAPRQERLVVAAESPLETHELLHNLQRRLRLAVRRV